jgi:hypothetical protein
MLSMRLKRLVEKLRLAIAYAPILKSTLIALNNLIILHKLF